MIQGYYKEKSETERKKLEQKKFMLQLEKEIAQLESKIAHEKVENFKIDCIKNLKISAKAIKLLVPYVVAAGIGTIGVCKLLGVSIPFWRDEKTSYLHYMKELDNEGNFRIEQQYKEFYNTSATLSYCEKWQKEDEGVYSRVKQVYSLEEVSEEDVWKILNGELALSEFLGNPIEEVVETNNNLPEEEIMREAYIEARIYGTDKEDFLLYKESVRENFWETMLFVLVYLFIISIPLGVKRELIKADFTFSAYRIKKNHPHFNTNDLRKKLEIKKANYDRLTR